MGILYSINSTTSIYCIYTVTVVAYAINVITQLVMFLYSYCFFNLYYVVAVVVDAVVNAVIL